MIYNTSKFNNINKFNILTNYIIFFFNDPATTEIYTLSLHDALPIWALDATAAAAEALEDLVLLAGRQPGALVAHLEDRKSTRLNSSHMSISYAVFCLKKKKKKNKRY